MSKRFSRFRFCQPVLLDDGTIMATDREPFPYVDLADNRLHVVKDGDNLWMLAAKFFATEASGGVEGALLWWVIADFQPDPIVDPTIRLATGRVLYIPSVRTLHELIFSEARRSAFL